MPGKNMHPSQCINVDVHYYSHPKVKRLVGLLGKGSADLPIRLWCHCGEYQGDTGRLTGYSAQEIEAACEWWGESGKMVKAFLKLNVLERSGKDFIVHDWTEWQGHIAALRQRGKSNRAKQLAKLAGSQADSVADSDARSTARPTALTDSADGTDSLSNAPLRGVKGRERRLTLAEQRERTLQEAMRP